MKALVVPEAKRLDWVDIAQPEPGPYDALVKIDCCGICNSTDAKLIDGQMFWAPPFPFVLGHESTGTVVELGARVKNYRVGDRVNRPLAFWPQTREGLNIAMGGFAEFGIVRDGAAMAADGDVSLQDDYNVLRQRVVNPALSAKEAALSISLAETASVLRSFPNLRGKTIAVLGTGVAGYAFMLWCKFAGAYVVAVGRREERLELAKETFGATRRSTPGMGMSRPICGTPRTVRSTACSKQRETPHWPTWRCLLCGRTEPPWPTAYRPRGLPTRRAGRMPP